MINHPVNGPLAVFCNDTQDGLAIAFDLVDLCCNRDAIGTVLTLTNDQGRTMSRETQLDGGFMSFDAPRVHFGLGRWFGTTLQGPLEAGALYTIRRGE